MSSSDLDSFEKKDLEKSDHKSGHKDYKHETRKIPIMEENEDDGYRESDDAVRKHNLFILLGS